MAECELKVAGNPIPMGKIKLDDDRGYVRWTFIPIAADGGVREGRVQVVGKDSKLNFSSGKHKGKPFGTLINFTLYHHNKKLTYTFVSGGKNFQCKFEDDFDF